MLPVINAPSLEMSIEQISKMCSEKFKLLPKTGKPSNNEWTILSGVVQHNKQNGYSQVVSLGSGTKCIGKSKLCPHGLILNDSHAEVMARRGLLRYLYHQLNNALTDTDSIFIWVPEKQKFELKDELSFHFLSTQTPCGDACIRTAEASERNGEPIAKKCKKVEGETDHTNLGSVIDIVYTGAKLIDNSRIDAMEQIVGAVRTKPGRGERTLSMSCSDKLAKWQVMGVQGALLDFFLTKPIYFVTLNFWGESSFASLERAIWKRFENNEFENSKYKPRIPEIRIFNKVVFAHAQCSQRKPSPNGLVWCDVPSYMRPYEISVNGKKQGSTTNKLQSPESALKISKYFLFHEFINVIKLNPSLLQQEENMEVKTYLDCKYLSKDYQNAWSDMKKYYFKQWSEKPKHMLKFCIKNLKLEK